MDPRTRDVPPVRAEPLFDLVVDLQPRLSFGAGPVGTRVFFGAAGGSFEGAALRGQVLQGGGDWALFGPDGTMSLDVRLALCTNDGERIHMTYGGRLVVPSELRAAMADTTRAHSVDPASYYFRTTPVFETGSTRYAWLNGLVCVGTGYLVNGGVAYRISRLL